MLIHYILSAALSLKLIFISFSSELSEISLSLSCSSSSLSFMVALQNPNSFSVYRYQCRECHLFCMHIDHCLRTLPNHKIKALICFLLLVKCSSNQLLTDHYRLSSHNFVALLLRDVAHSISCKSSLDSCSRIKGYCSQHFLQILA